MPVFGEKVLRERMNCFTIAVTVLPNSFRTKTGLIQWSNERNAQLVHEIAFSPLSMSKGTHSSSDGESLCAQS